MLVKPLRGGGGEVVEAPQWNFSTENQFRSRMTTHTAQHTSPAWQGRTKHPAVLPDVDNMTAIGSATVCSRVQQCAKCAMQLGCVLCAFRALWGFVGTNNKAAMEFSKYIGTFMGTFKYMVGDSRISHLFLLLLCPVVHVVQRGSFG